MTAGEPLVLLCDALALIYHQARKVRHLVERGNLRRDKWRQFVMLDRGRDDSWMEIAPVRAKALATSSVDAALAVFEDRFGASVEDLAAIFTSETWRHTKRYGGRAGAAIDAWGTVVALTLKLGSAARTTSTTVETIVADLRQTRVDGGSFSEKFDRLEAVRPRTERRAHRER